MKKTKVIDSETIEYNKEIYKKEKTNWLKIPELKIEVEIDIHDKGKSWNELKLNKREKELLDFKEVVWLANSKYAKQLKMDGSSSKDDFFIKQFFDLNRKKGLVAFFSAVGFEDLGRDLALYGSYLDGDGDYFAVGVRFKRRIK